MQDFWTIYGGKRADEMSNETLQAVWNAAKAFVADTEQLAGLRAALTAHDESEASEATPEATEEPAAAPTEEPAAPAEAEAAPVEEPSDPPTEDATDPAPNAQ